MQNALVSIKDVIAWIDKNKCYIWTLYSSDRKTMLSRNPSITEPVESKEWIEFELKKRSAFGGTFWLYINEKAGNGGLWSEIMLPAQNGSNGVAGINGGVMPYVGDIQGIIAQERKMWELEKKVEELENSQAHHAGFLERQAESLLQHPDLDPNVVMMSIGGLASRLVTVAELLLGVNGLTDPNGGNTPPQYNYQRKPKPEQQPDPVNGAHAQEAQPSNGDNVETAEEIQYDGDALAEVCDDLAVIYPSVPPEELLMRMRDLLKSDKMIQGMVKKKLQIQ